MDVNIENVYKSVLHIIYDLLYCILLHILKILFFIITLFIHFQYLDQCPCNPDNVINQIVIQSYSLIYSYF